MAEFDFCPNSHVAEEVPPEEPSIVTMNGWDFTARPGIPYRPRFRLTLDGLFWHLDGAMLDIVTNPETNAGRLQQFYREHRTWKSFVYKHEYLGAITCRFASPVTLPKALPSAGGLIPSVEVMLVQHNPGY